MNDETTTIITPEQAHQAIEDDKQQRMKALAKIIENATAELRCDLVALPQYTPDGRTVAVLQIIAR